MSFVSQLPPLGINGAEAADWPMLIDGEWVASRSKASFDVMDPGTEEVIAQVPRGVAEDVDDAVAAARRAFDSRAWLNIPAPERARAIWRIADLIEANAE